MRSLLIFIIICSAVSNVNAKIWRTMDEIEFIMPSIVYYCEYFNSLPESLENFVEGLEYMAYRPNLWTERKHFMEATVFNYDMIPLSENVLLFMVERKVAGMELDFVLESEGVRSCFLYILDTGTGFLCTESANVYWKGMESRYSFYHIMQHKDRNMPVFLLNFQRCWNNSIANFLMNNCPVSIYRKRR